ncbi:uncharacterized protein METZ01_LOCUS280415 [marine metagenome]|uniref:Uncharacterized protein n=1 Tax=marine metagenome TaxID=408172 RepID=A0A382KY08_9ZZZZ
MAQDERGQAWQAKQMYYVVVIILQRNLIAGVRLNCSPGG